MGRKAENARSTSPPRGWYGPNWAGPGGPAALSPPHSRGSASERSPRRPRPRRRPRLRPSSPPLCHCGETQAALRTQLLRRLSPLPPSAQAAPGGGAALGGRRGPAAAEPSTRRSQLCRPRGAVTGAGSPPETHLQGLSRCPPCGGPCRRSALARKVSDRRSRRLCAQRAWGQMRAAWGPRCVCVCVCVREETSRPIYTPSSFSQ